MKIIICTGSPHSGYERVAEVLSKFGMNNNMYISTEEKVELFVLQNELFKELTIKYEDSASEYAQIYPDESYTNRATDLINKINDNNFWGWADYRSTWLLDFWRKVDSRVFFLLVYSEPSDDFCRNMLESRSNKRIREFLDSWFSYNRELLRFYNRNMDRSVLVNSESCLSDIQKLFKICEEKIGLQLESNKQINDKYNEKTPSIAKLIACNSINNRADIRVLSNEMESTATIPKNIEHDDISQEGWEEYFKDLKKAETIESETKKLQKEIELNQLQLVQLQDELEYYFRLNKENEAKIAAQATAIQEGRYLANMDEPIDGENWYSSESDINGIFRWTGPGLRTTIKLPVKRNRKLLLLIEYRNTFNVRQLDNLKVEIDGSVFPHSVYKYINPRFILVNIPVSEEDTGNRIEIAIVLPETISPESVHQNTDDGRKLGICINSVAVIPHEERLYIEEPVSELGWLKKKVQMLRYRLTDRDSPLVYFDGLRYLEENNEVATAVEKGLISSAWDHYVSNGLKDKRFSFATSRRPSYGNLIDLIRHRSE